MVPAQRSAAERRRTDRSGKRSLVSSFQKKARSCSTRSGVRSSGLLGGFLMSYFGNSLIQNHTPYSTAFDNISPATSVRQTHTCTAWHSAAPAALGGNAFIQTTQVWECIRRHLACHWRSPTHASTAQHSTGFMERSLLARVLAGDKQVNRSGVGKGASPTLCR